MGIAKYLLKRLITAIPIFLFAVALNFLIIHSAPGSPVDFILSSGEYHLLTADTVKEIIASYGLDKPLHMQFIIYIAKIFRGDLGYSFTYHIPVSELIWERLGRTLLFVLPSFLISVTLGILVGIKSSEKAYSLADNVFTIVSLLLWAMPFFWFSMILIQVFAVNLHLLPAQSIADIGVIGFERVKSLILHLIMPITVMGLGGFASFSRYTRSSMLEILNKDYIMTAWAKGATQKMVYRKHAFKNAALPIITLIALRIPSLFMGSVLIETVFSYPGLGMLLFKCITRRDYNVIQGIFLIFTIITLISNIIADLLYAYLDPQIRYGD